MNLPKVQFCIAPKNETLSLLNYFLNPPKDSFDWSNIIFEFYPALKKRLEIAKDKKDRRKITAGFFSDVYDQEKQVLLSNAELFQEEWNKINDRVMKALSDVVELAWPSDFKMFTARVSLNPICPRFIKKRVFDVFYRRTIRQMQAVSIHELLHFIYFERWKTVFPDTKEREFDTPYLVWHLSEMVPGIILNDPRIRGIVKNWKYHSYKEYEAIKINGISMLSRLQDLYDDRTSFATFLQEAWKFVQKNEKLITSI